jgi:ribosomal protein S18 acetylase RimI-like enzyme
MSGYFGSEAQRLLQRRAREAVAWDQATPGAVRMGRFLGTDDPDQLGWDAILALLERDRTFGFRMIPADAVEELRDKLAGHGYRIDFWNVFAAGRAAGAAKVDAIVAEPLPEGLRLVDIGREPESQTVRAAQTLMAESGVAPFAGIMLTGGVGPAATVLVADAAGAIVAAAHTYRPHNPFSPHHGAAWVGLVAVAPSQRGRGLGRLVNAHAIGAAFDRLGAGSVYEQVSATNIPSRRMVEAAGLALDPSLVAGIAVPADTARFTA